MHQTTFLQPYPEPTVPDSSYVLSSTTVSTTLHPLALRSRTDSLRSPYIDQQPQALLLSPPPQQQIHQIIQPSDANFVENAIGVLRELSRELYNLEEDNLRLKKQQKILDEQIGELQQSDRQQRSRKRRYSDLVSVVLHERDFPAFMPFVLNRADAPFVVLKPIFVPGSPHIKLIGLAFSPAVCKLLGWPEVLFQKIAIFHKFESLIYKFSIQEELLGDEEEKIRPFTPTESNEYDNSKNDSLFMLAQQGQVARVSSTMLVNTVAHGVDGVPRDATLRYRVPLHFLLGGYSYPLLLHNLGFNSSSTS